MLKFIKHIEETDSNVVVRSNDFASEFVICPSPANIVLWEKVSLFDEPGTSLFNVQGR